LQLAASAETINGKEYLIPGHAFALAHNLFELAVRRMKDDFPDLMFRIVLILHGASLGRAV
jgi:hypothetical protein